MNKKLILALAALLIVPMGIGTAIYWPAPEVSADWDTECDGCSWILVTPTLTGTGANCAAALADLHAEEDLQMAMTCPDTPLCGTPARTTTVACHTAGGQKSVSGYSAFRCEWELENDPGCY